MRKVVVTHFALHQIKSIYDYYCFHVSVKVAKKLESEIIFTIKSLKQKEVEWQEDEFLVYVTDVFDSRQDPVKENG